MDNKEDIVSNEENSFSDNDSGRKKNNQKKKDKQICDYSYFSALVVKIQVSIVFLIYALVFSHNQTSRNKDLKDEEISQNDYFLGLIYIITLIITIIIGVNAFFTLSRDYDVIKTEDIFQNNFMKCKLYFK